MSGVLTPAILYNCCLKNAEPVWSRFRSLTISGVRDLRSQTGVDKTECVACPDDEAQFWTLYGRTKDGDSEALTDAPTKAAALVIAGFHMAQARVAGVPLDLEEWAVLSTASTDYTDAARWRALMSSQRIRVMGSAGLRRDEAGNLTVRSDGHLHIGVEFWSVHESRHPSAEYPQERSREILTFYADFLRRRTPGAST
ncbi:MAG: hypothetical protein FD144_2626 [Rhodospirillaceae bacterium]|nr:MAG: hypothetical protein FD144_2626 [Rhodospirillaceae bacterium]